jgi:hypothetical protein
LKKLKLHKIIKPFWEQIEMKKETGPPAALRKMTGSFKKTATIKKVKSPSPPKRKVVPIPEQPVKESVP